MNKTCPHCLSTHIQKKSYYFVKHSRSKLRRYFCVACNKSFSNQTSSPTYKQHKPQLNLKLFHLLTDGVSARAASRILGCTKNTVDRKFLWLGQFAESLLKQNTPTPANTWMFDEMESIEHTKLKPLTIPLCVDSKYQILAISSAKIPAKGKLASISQSKYGPRPSHRADNVNELLLQLAKLPHPQNIITDGSALYKKLIRKYFPTTSHLIVNSQKLLKLKREKIYSKDYKLITDPMFPLNQRCAKLRNDIRRLTRRSWCTTKKLENLILHLNLYKLKNNQLVST